MDLPSEWICWINTSTDSPGTFHAYEIFTPAHVLKVRIFHLKIKCKPCDTFTLITWKPLATVPVSSPSIPGSISLKSICSIQTAMILHSFPTYIIWVVNIYCGHTDHGLELSVKLIEWTAYLFHLIDLKWKENDAVNTSLTFCIQDLNIILQNVLVYNVWI